MKTITIASIADSHWDSSAGGRLEECTKLHTWINQDMRAQKVDIICHAGDVFDRKSTPDDRNAAAAWFQDAAEIGPVVAVRGNHDVVGDLSIFNRIDGRNVILAEEYAMVHRLTRSSPSKTWELNVDIEDLGDRDTTVSIACASWPRKGELLRDFAGMSHEQSEQEARTALRQMFHGLAGQLKLARAHGPRILLMHAMVTGSITSTGQPLVGCDFEVDLTDLAIVPAQIVLLGHIHKAQEWEFNGVPIVYSGSPRRTAYGEIEEKGYVLVTFELDETEESPAWKLKSWRRRICPAQPMLLAEDEWDHEWKGGLAWLGAQTDILGADVRFRYTVPAEQAEAAKLAAADVEARLRALGAARVKIEGEKVGLTRQRSTEITGAKTVAAKLGALWTARGELIDDDQRGRIIDKVTQLETERAAHAEVSGTAGGSLRFDYLRLRGIGPFKDIELPISQLPGPLVAITGDNGEGKTVLCEALAACCYRNTPTRGTLKSLATSRDSLAEVHVMNGSSWRIQHTLDAHTDAAEVSVLDGEGGAPQLADAKVSSFDAWRKKNLMAPEVLYASSFGVQASGGFLSLDPTDRKAVLIRILGHEYLEDLAKAAGKHATASATELEATHARIEEITAGHQPVAICETDVRMAQQTAEATNGSWQVAQEKLGALEREVQAAMEEQKRRKELSARVAEHCDATKAAEDKYVDLRRRLENNRRLVERAPMIRAAKAELDAIVDEQLDLDRAIERATEAETQHGETAKVAMDRVERLTAEASSESREISMLTTKLMKAMTGDEYAELDQTKIPTKAGQVFGSRLLLNEMDEHISELIAFQREGVSKRVNDLRGGHMNVLAAASLRMAQTASKFAIDIDDRRVAEDHDGRVDNMRQKQEELREASQGAERELTQLRSILAGREHVDHLRQQHADVVERWKATCETLQGACDERERASERASAAAAVVLPLREKLASLVEAKDKLDPDVRYAENIDAAEARAEELTAQIVDTEAAITKSKAAAQQALDEMNACRPGDFGAELDAARRAVAAADRARTEATAEVARREQTLRAAIVAGARAAELLAQKGACERALADWRKLHLDLGRTGVQAIEIDAAGPALTEVTNELLHRCHGPRYTLTIETTRASADGKKQIEDFAVMVTDDEKGRHAEARTYSGGQRVIIGEALSLALVVVACQSAGITAPTLVRDETGAALSPANCIAYVAMLRRAAQMVGADKVLFVSHQDEMNTAADCRVVVANGGISIQ